MAVFLGRSRQPGPRRPACSSRPPATYSKFPAILPSVNNAGDVVFYSITSFGSGVFVDSGGTQSAVVSIFDALPGTGDRQQGALEDRVPRLRWPPATQALVIARGSGEFPIADYLTS